MIGCDALGMPWDAEETHIMRLYGLHASFFICYPYGVETHNMRLPRQAVMRWECHATGKRRILCVSTTSTRLSGNRGRGQIL